MADKETDNSDCLPEYGNLGSGFDFAAFCERIRTGQGTPKDHEEFTVRAMQLLCIAVYREEQPEKWVLNYFADQFFKILNGGAWCDELPLPGIPQSQIRTRAQSQGLSIYCDVENSLRANTEAKITKLLIDAAKTYSTSYETARGEYYKWKAYFSKEAPKKLE